MTRHRGFTLIELMVVVSIVGIIASVAVPQFIQYQYRSRQTERSVVMRSIRVAIDDYFTREGRFPNGTPPITTLLCDWNPGPAPATSRTAWRLTGPDNWQQLPFAIDGSVYYAYYAFALNIEGGFRQYQIDARGDLDGDTRLDWIQKLYQYNGVTLSKPVVPPANACDDCTIQSQLGDPNTF